MPRSRRTAADLELVGGELCLDFANTVSVRGKPATHDYLSDFTQLVAWARHARLATAREADQLRQLASQSPTEAERVLRHAVSQRERIYRIFSAIAAGSDPAEPELETLGDAFVSSLRHAGLRRTAAGFTWAWPEDGAGLDRLLQPIVHSAVALLLSPELDQVQRCGNHAQCDWLFVDRSKNRSRRWCTMQICGSRAKSRRYYRRSVRSG